MWLAVDVGNTSIACGVFDGAKLVQEFRLTTDASRTADDYLQDIKSQLPHPITAIVACSVVPALDSMVRFVADKLGVELSMVGSNFDVPLTLDVDTPAEVGADRLVASYAAYNMAPSSHHIIIDFGTATTFDVVQHGGVYAGGVIAPGVNLSLAALEHAAAKLPHIEVKEPAALIGKNTVEAMQSGIFYGYLSMVEGVVQRLKEQLQGDVKVTATGGLSSLFAPACASIDVHDETLMMSGLLKIAQHYNQLGSN